MRFRLMGGAALAAGLVAFMVTAGASAGPAPSASAHASGAAHALAHNGAGATLFDNTSGNTGVGWTSQNFESDYDAYDTMAATSFAVPAGHTWTVTEVDVAATNQGVNANSFNVLFYSNNKKTGLPKKLNKKSASNDANFTEDGSGDAWINLPSKGVKLKGGKTYWVSVQANQDFNSEGQWWWNTSSTPANPTPAWQNPGNGFGTNCTTWGTLSTCLGGADPAFAVRLAGSST